MNIDEVVTKIKNSPIKPYIAIVGMVCILTYMGFRFMTTKEHRSSTPSNSVQEGTVTPLSDAKKRENDSSESMNQKRVVEKMKIDYKKSKNPNDVYLTSQDETSQNNFKVDDYKLNVQNKIYQADNISKLSSNTTKNSNEKLYLSKNTLTKTTP